MIRYLSTAELTPGVVITTNGRRYAVTSEPIITEGERSATVGVRDMDTGQEFPVLVTRGANWRCEIHPSAALSGVES